MLGNTLLFKCQYKSVKYEHISQIFVPSSEVLMVLSVYTGFTTYCKPSIILNKATLKSYSFGVHL